MKDMRCPCGAGRRTDGRTFLKARGDCWKCHLEAVAIVHRPPPAKPKVTALELLAPPCPHRGTQITGVVGCEGCGQSQVTVTLVRCSYYGDECFTGGYAPRRGRSCMRCPVPSRTVTPVPEDFVPDKTDPPVGVSIGAYKWPALIDLQVRLIRKTCGMVPILVSDDMPGSPHADRVEALQRVCMAHKLVFYDPNPRWIGHAGGDLAAFWKGIRWGAEHGLRVVAKLSQRLLITRSRWLQDGAKDLIASGLCLATRKNVGSQAAWPVRAEGCLLDVRKWSEPGTLASVLPRELGPGANAEGLILNVVRRHGGYWPWDVFTEDRFFRNRHCLWHHSHDEQEYRAFARSHFGVELDKDFHRNGWEKEDKNGEYKIG